MESRRTVFVVGAEEFMVSIDKAIDGLKNQNSLNETLSDRRDFIFCVAVAFCQALRPLLSEAAEEHHDVELSLSGLFEKARTGSLVRGVEGSA